MLVAASLVADRINRMNYVHTVGLNSMMSHLLRFVVGILSRYGTHKSCWRANIRGLHPHSVMRSLHTTCLLDMASFMLMVKDKEALMVCIMI